MHFSASTIHRRFVLLAAIIGASALLNTVSSAGSLVDLVGKDNEVLTCDVIQEAQIKIESLEVPTCAPRKITFQGSEFNVLTYTFKTYNCFQAITFLTVLHPVVIKGYLDVGSCNEQT